MKCLFNEIYLNSNNNMDYIFKRDYMDIIVAIDNIPDMFYESKKNIVTKINAYIENN